MTEIYQVRVITNDNCFGQKNYEMPASHKWYQSLSEALPEYNEAVRQARKYNDVQRVFIERRFVDWVDM